MRKKLVIFSGAGMSAESGIGTFRDSGGLWEKFKIEEVATPDAWRQNPDLVSDFYNQRRKQIVETLPNKAHSIISELEKQFDVHVITQNIDDLHERAGSSNVLHLHGNIRYAKSSGPNQEKKYYSIDGWELTKNDLCEDGYRLRPHVVWFGESVPALEEAVEILDQSDYLVVIGTSLQVYPAAGLIHYVPRSTNCFIIDPNVDSFSIPSNFKKLNCGAIEGMERIKEMLENII